MWNQNPLKELIRVWQEIELIIQDHPHRIELILFFKIILRSRELILMLKIDLRTIVWVFLLRVEPDRNLLWLYFQWKKLRDWSRPRNLKRKEGTSWRKRKSAPFRSRLHHSQGRWISMRERLRDGHFCDSGSILGWQGGDCPNCWSYDLNFLKYKHIDILSSTIILRITLLFASPRSKWHHWVHWVRGGNTTRHQWNFFALWSVSSTLRIFLCGFLLVLISKLQLFHFFIALYFLSFFCVIIIDFGLCFLGHRKVIVICIFFSS